MSSNAEKKAHRVSTLLSHLNNKENHSEIRYCLTASNVKSTTFEDPNANEVALDANSLFGMKGKICLVTGGSRGIGKMIASGFVANGAKVFICSRNAKLCEEVAAQLNSKYGSSSNGGTAEALPGDLSTLEGVEKLVESLKLKTDKLHVLVNNAGSTWGAPIETFPDQAWEKVMNLNVRHVFNLTKLCLPLLKNVNAIPSQASAASESAKTNKNDGVLKEGSSYESMHSGDPARVIMISSVGGIRNQFFGPTSAFSYTASKAALIHLTKDLSRNFAEHNITVNCIAPGVFPSNMTKFMLASENARKSVEEDNPLKRNGRTSDMAATCLYLASKGGAFTNGAVIIVDGGRYLF